MNIGIYTGKPQVFYYSWNLLQSNDIMYNVYALNKDCERRRETLQSDEDSHENEETCGTRRRTKEEMNKE